MKDSESQDRDAIIALIEAESTAWMRGDVEGWKACWVQDDHAQHINARPSVGARMLHGFQTISAFMVPHMEQIRDAKGPVLEIRRENWRITVGHDMAWATFDQIIPLGPDDNTAPGLHNQLRILERHAGEWKIAAIFQIPNRIGYYASPWIRTDRTGRILEAGAQAEAALAGHPSLRRVGERLAARTGRDQRKLRAALDEADKLIRDRRGRRPHGLVLSEPTGSGISLVWISTADMMIVVHLGDDRLLGASIANAGETFGLSRTQMRVAELIAQGRDLNQIAAALDVMPNTVRTHVRRMFQRVEVNNQAALIRALLTAEGPHP